MLLSSILLSLSAAIVAGQNFSTCTNPRIRKSWHVLSNDEKLAYINAAKCLFSKPAHGAAYFPASQNRHDDFSSLHINQTSPPDPDRLPKNRGVIGPGVHFNGVFLPWHRYVVWTYESALIDECGYTGAQPYWDWPQDTSEYGSTLSKSPLFDPVYGFGGNGANGTMPGDTPGQMPRPNATVGSCIVDGPFASTNNSLGPSYNLDRPNPHCIIRNFNESLFEASAQWEKNVIPLLGETDFFNFTIKMSGPGTGAPVGVHGAGHSGVGGEMRDLWSSTNDPIFYLHHAQIDHMWSIWQGISEENAKAYNGPIYPDGTGISTLDSSIYMTPFIAPDRPVRDLMDTLNKDGTGFLCYKYEDNPKERIPTFKSKRKVTG